MTPIFSADSPSPGTLVQALDCGGRFAIVLVTPDSRKLLDEIWKGSATRQK